MASRVSGYSLNKRLKENQAKRQIQTRSRVSGYSKYGTSYNAKNSGSTLGYLGGSLAAGIGGIGEGIVDLTAATGAFLTGQKEYAKYVFKDNVVGDWHQSLTENYNPGDIMGFMGNVAHSMGQSSVMLLDAIGVPVGSVAFYGGMIGQGISNAAEKTGDVGFKEVAYGASVGVAEGILETYLGGAGKAVKNIVGSTFKNVGKNAVRKGLLREILSDAGQEFAEEFASEYVDVFLQRMTGVDKNASTTIKDAAYSGLVGFFSGVMSAGTSDVIRYAATKQKGAQIIASGNAQTLVNTAEAMVNKLAGAGTNFKNTAEWIRMLRADVDAYNKLSAEQKVGAKGAEILGEMQAALGFSELQTVLGGVQESIQGESQANREMLAEYINQTVDKAKRKKDYTAEDVSNNTDNIATQLAVLKAVGLVDLEGAIADARYESAIADVIASETEASDEVRGKSEELRSDSEGIVPNSAENSGIVPEMSGEADAIVPENGAQDEIIEIDIPSDDYGEDELISEDEVPVGEVKHDLSDDVRDIESHATVIDDDIERIRENVKKAVTQIRVDGKLYELGAKHVDNIARGVQKYIRQGMSESDAIAKAVETRLVEIKSMGDESGVKHELGRATLEKVRGAVINAYREGIQDTTRKERKEPKKAQPKAKKKNSKAKAKAESRAETVAESGSESEPVVHEAKEIFTAEQRVERARERARRWIEWEKRTAPKVAELNAAREAVKGFDDLDITRRLAIVRMIRSAQESGTKVDPKILKGVANLMAAKTKDGRYFAGDLEVRFAEGIGSRGLHTTVGGKHLILLDPSVKYAETIKGTVAHEIVHYLENRAGYAQLAEFAKKNAKQSSIDEIRAKYDTFYTDMYTAEEQEKGGSEEEIAARVKERMESAEYKELIDSEIVASLVGEGLKSERFLKRYAEKDDKLIRRVWNYLKGLKKALKDRDPEADKIVDEMALRMDLALQSGVVKESAGGVKHDQPTKQQIAAWEKPITLQDVETLRSIGRKSVNQFTSNDIKKAQKWAYKFYKDIGVKSPFFRAWFGEWRAHDVKNPSETINIPQGVNINTANRYVKNADTKWKIQITEDLFGDSLHYAFNDKLYTERLLTHIDEVIEKAIYLDTAIVDKNKGNKKGSSQFMHYLYAVVEYQGAPFLAKLAVEEYNFGNSERAYNVQRIKMSTLSRAQYSQLKTAYRGNYASSVDAISIADLYEFVKTYDEEFSPAPEVSEFALNADGTPKVFYHGTNQGDFNEFLWEKTQKADGGFFGRGHYFTASKSMAELYGKRIVNAYLSFKNPFIWSEEVAKLEGSKGSNIVASNLISRINMARVFPTLFADKAIEAVVYNNDTGEYEPKTVKWPELKDEIEKVGEAMHLQKFADGSYQWFTQGRFWDESIGDRYNSIEEAEKDKFSAAAIAFSNKYQGVAQGMSFDDQSTFTQQYGDEITKLLKKMGYDASMQNPGGDEIVMFESEQIKSADKPRTENANIGTFDKSTGNIKRDLDPDKKYRAPKKAAKEQGRDVYFENAELRGSNRDLTQKLEESKAETKKARNEAEAFKKGNKILNQKLVATRAESARYKAEAKSLARQIAQDAYETDAKTFTQKEVEALIERINEYSTDKFKDVMNEKSAKISKADKEQFAFDIYVAFHVASADKRAIERINVLADKLARQYLDNVYYSEDGSRVYLNEILDEATYNEYVNTFRKKIMASFKSMGRETTHARLTAIYRAEMAKLKKQMLDAEAEGKNLRELQYQAKQLRTTVDIQKRSPQDEGIYNVEKEMSRIADERGRINAKQADKAFDQMHLFLTSDSGKMDSALEEMAQVEGESMIELIEEYKHSRAQSGSKYLNSREMELAAKIIAGGRKILREYNRVFYNGHWEDMGKLAAETVTDLLSFSGAEREYKTKIGKFLGEKVGKGIQQAYFYNILSPENVVEALEGYKKNGVLKTLYHAVREATQKSEHMAVMMKKPFAEYLDDKENDWTDGDGKKHSFRDKLNEKTVKVNGYEITLGEAIYLYMLAKREHAHLGLQEAGFVTYDENNQSKLQFKIIDIDGAATQIMDQLDATDKTFLDMAEKFFNETASKIKYDADMKILGYTNNIQDAYYVPIIRDRYERMANVTDKRQSVGSIVTVYNKSFTQQTIKNAKALEGKNIMEIINDHADGLADYSELYLPLKSFDRIYNTRVITDTAQSTSIRKALNDKVWRGSDKYFKKLFADIQGQGEERGTLDEMVGKLRTGWVNSVLGLNLKVVATQTTSFVAANQVIEMKYLAPALAKFVGDVSELGARADEYSDIIEARNFDMGAIKAQGNIDKVARWAEKTGFMINWMDRRVCLAIFHAAELKAEAQGAGAVGTVENAKEAARIADEVIYTTQAMTSRAEKSQLQRHKSEIAKMFAMFTSDSVKQLSHLYGNVMKYIAHQERAKTDPAYEAELKKDAKAMGRSATTVLMTGVMLGIITQGFKYLYAQEEEEPEEKAKDFAIDMISSTLNILPIVSDVADKFIFGYDMSLNVLDIANDTIENTSKLFSMAGKAMSGEYVSNDEVGKNLMDAVKAYGTMFGVPISPVERTITGVLRRFTPSTVYGYDAVFSNLSYTSDLKKAVEKGDERLAEHVLSKLYKDEVAGVYTSEELSEVVRLYGEGYTSVLPQRIGDEVNGVKLDRKQRKRFNAIYGEASDKVDSMIRTSEFSALTDEQRAKAIKNLYTLYYSHAESKVAGKEWSNAQAYAALLNDPTMLFVAQAYKGGLESYNDASGKEVTVKSQFVSYAKSLGLSDGEYAVVAYANGVRDKKTRADILKYINSLGLDEETKTRVAERLGFVIKNGAVSEDDA